MSTALRFIANADLALSEASEVATVTVGSVRFSRLAKSALSALFVVSLSMASAAPVVTHMVDGSSASATALVYSLLSSSPGLSVVDGSAIYTGAVTASGTFTAGGTGPSGLGLDSGVVLTTGDARFIGSSAAFVGDSANKSGDFTSGVGNSLTPNNTSGNSLFNSLTSSGNANASILSFSFVPEGSRLTLQLVFGSEDYNDLVNAGFPTDVLGIFVNGINYGLVPGTSAPISASSINCGGPTPGPAPNVGGQNCALYRDNAPFFDLIDSELDGLTVAINLSIPVSFGAVNTISIGIADNVDSFGDSALLLANGSISAGSSSVPEPSTIALVLTAVAGLAAVSRHRKAARQ
jgi:hypothetical protein